MKKEIANKKNTLKENLITALEKTKGIVTDACKQANISRSTYYKYYKQDDQFKADVDEINNIALDHAESKLFKLIDDCNVTAIIFYLKTRGKSRGYTEKQEVQKNEKLKIIVTREKEPKEMTDAELNEIIAKG